MSATLPSRARQVLLRFPRHLDAAQPGKLLGNLVAGLVRDQDVQAADLQGIRRAHRVLEAQELRDLLLHAALHGLDAAEMAVLFLRFDSAARARAALQQQVAGAADPSQTELLAEQVLGHWMLPHAEPLRLFSADPDSSDPLLLPETVAVLLQSLAQALTRRMLVDLVRRRVLTSARIHQDGNATVSALLTAVANALDLDLGPISHASDRYWHAAPAWDRWRLPGPSLDAAGRSVSLVPATEYVGLEENPHVPAQRGPAPRTHAELFHTIRKGFEDALLEIRVTGIAARTLAPMLVNRDAGHGVGLFAAVPAGSTLVFTQSGRALLDGADVTSRAYAWQGACFADGTAEPFVFAGAGSAEGRSGRFVLASPAGALDRAGQFPHGGDSLPMRSIGVGKTHFAFFVRHGHFAALQPGAAGTPPAPPADVFGTMPLVERQRVHTVTPRSKGAVANAALFAGGSTNPFGVGDGGGAAAQVALHWQERQAYSVRAIIPNRFRLLDGADGVRLADQVRHALQRFRPAGIDVRVEFAEQRWLLGAATLPQAQDEAADPLSQIRPQTELWPSPDPIPDPAPVTEDPP